MDVDRKKIYDSKVKEGDRLDVNSMLTLSRIDIKKVKDIQAEIDQYAKKDIPELIAKELNLGSLATKMELTDGILSIKKVEFELKFLRDRRGSVVKNASEEKSEAAKGREAESDEVYQKYNQDYQSAKIVREYLELKRADMEQAHYAFKAEYDYKRGDRVQGTKTENVGF